MRYVLFAFSLFLFAGCSGDKNRKLKKQVHKLAAVNDSLQTIIDEQTGESEDSTLTFWKFSKKGIKNPQAFITKELRSRTELIPMKPVLGGAMRFSKITVLGDNWVIGVYEDGHVRGKTLYRYELKKDTTLTFKKLFSVPSQ